MLLGKSNIKAVYRYKQVSPEIAQVKTQAVLRILADALKKQRYDDSHISNDEGQEPVCVGSDSIRSLTSA